MTRIPSLLGALVLALSLSACPEDVDPPVDMPRIEIGTGDIGDYETVMDGDTALLVRGSQGGQHIWVGIRAWDINTRPALIQLLLESDATGETLSIPFQVRLTFQDEVPPDADFDQISGLALVVPDADAVLGQRVTIRARVSENRTGGLMAESFVRDLFVEWDPDNPPGFRPGEDGSIPLDADVPDGGGPADASVGDADAADADPADAGVVDASFDV